MNRKTAFALLTICYTFMLMVRMSAPEELDIRDQAKQGLYILDVANGVSFFLPTCHLDPASKPPMYNWVGAGISLVWGKVNDITIRLPSALSGFGIVVLTFLAAEMLFSLEIAFFSGLILILNYHFTTLSWIARTDMMLSFFITLSLFLFLLAYRNQARATVYSLLMFVSFGLGTLTKGPIGIAVPLLVIVIFLFFKKDMKFLRSMRFGWGMLIWTAITLVWFIPALIEGGSGFFDIVIRKEMVDRALGIGHNGRKGTRPFYYFIPHFFGKFLPWSLFMPSALLYYWKSKDSDEKNRLLFPVVWFFAVLIFFSIPAGKRYDYILPLYPAASIVVGHFWYSAIKQNEAGRGENQIRVVSLSYLAAYCFLAVGLLFFLFLPTLANSIASIFMIRPREPFHLQQRVVAYPGLVLVIVLPSLATAIAGIGFGLKRNLRGLFTATLVVAALSLALYFDVISNQATGMSGEQKKAFCKRAAGKIDSTANLRFCGTSNSILFYFAKNEPLLSIDEAVEFCKSISKPYLITTETIYKALQRRTDFELIVLEESERLVRDKKRYVLVGRMNPNQQILTGPQLK